MRNVIGLAILGAAVVARPSLRAGFGARRLPLQVGRNLVHFGATYAWALGVTLLPLATVFALEFTAPAWVGLLAALILKERLTASRIASIALGFVGILVILRPGAEAMAAGGAGRARRGASASRSEHGAHQVAHRDGDAPSPSSSG